MNLTMQKERLAIARLAPRAAFPEWALRAPGFLSICRTAEELSIVCEDSSVPPDTQAERGRRALKVEGPLDFALTGILSALLEPLAAAKISVFAISTYDTDYVLVNEVNLAEAVSALRGAGHLVLEA